MTEKMGNVYSKLNQFQFSFIFFENLTLDDSQKELVCRYLH